MGYQFDPLHNLFIFMDSVMVESKQALEVEISYMKKSIDEIKADMKSITAQLSENSRAFNQKVDSVISTFKSEYVSKTEFQPYQEKVNWLQKGLLWVVGLVLASVVWAILKLVIK